MTELERETLREALLFYQKANVLLDLLNRAAKQKYEPALPEVPPTPTFPPGGVVTSGDGDPVLVAPTDPSPPPCKQGPDIRGIERLQGRELWVRFHGEEVWELTVSVLQGARIVHTEAIFPDSSLLKISLPQPLAPGRYTLRLRGKSCTGQSLLDFTVPPPGVLDELATEPAPAPWDASVPNPGVWSVDLNGLRYEWIRAQLATIEVRSDGRVRIVGAPATKTTFLGAHTAHRHLVVDECDVSGAFEEAIFGEGVPLAMGQYSFGLHYYRTRPASVNELDVWKLTRPEGGEERVGLSEYVILSITPIPPTT
jgi:hypothetical protein